MCTIVAPLHLNWPFDNDSDTVNFGVGAPKLFSKVVCKTCKWQTSCLECWQFVTSATSIVWDCYHCVSIVTPETLTRHLKAGCAGKCQNNNHIRHKLFYYFSHRFCPEFFNTFDFFSRCHTKYWIFGARWMLFYNVKMTREEVVEEVHLFICWQRPPSAPPWLSSNMFGGCIVWRHQVLLYLHSPHHQHQDDGIFSLIRTEGRVFSSTNLLERLVEDRRKDRHS